MPQRDESIYLPLLRFVIPGIKSQGDQQKAKEMQSSSYLAFASQRNARKLEIYMYTARTERYKIAVAATLFIATILGSIGAGFKIQDLYRNMFSQHSLNQIEVLTKKILTAINFHLNKAITTANVFAKTFFPLLRLNEHTTTSSIRNLTQNFVQSYMRSSQNIILWTYIDLEGTMAGYYASTYKEVSKGYLIYAEKTAIKANHIYVWKVDQNGWNDAFPLSGGIAYGEETYNITNENWLKRVFISRNSQWGEPYFYQIGNETVPIAHYSATTIDETSIDKNILGIMSIGLNLTVIQSVLDGFSPSNRSRMAFAVEGGMIMAITGTDPITDPFQGSFVTKNIYQLRDNIWQQITPQAQFRTGQNFTASVNIDGDTEPYSVLQIPIESGGPEKWSVIVCIPTMDVISFDYDLLMFPILLIVTLATLTVVAIAAIDWLLRDVRKALEENLVTIRENHGDLLNQPSSVTLVILRKLCDFIENPVIRKEIQDAVTTIQLSGKDALDFSSEFANRTNNEELKKYLRKRFSPQPLLTAALVKRFSRSSVPPAIATDSSDTETSSKETDFASIEKPLRAMSGIPSTKIAEFIIEVMKRANLFEENGIGNIINRIVSEMKTQFQPLLFDSFELLCFFQTNKVEFEMELFTAMCISILAFHRAMGDRSHKKDIERLFLTDFEPLLDECILLLVEFEKILKKDAKNAENTFTKVSIHCSTLINIAPVSSHQWMFTNSLMFHSGIRKKQHLPTHDTIEDAKMVFLAMTLSFLFGPNYITEEALHLIGCSFKDCLLIRYSENFTSVFKLYFGTDFTNLLSNNV